MTEYTDTNEKNPALEFPAAFRLSNNQGLETASGKTRAIIAPESLSLRTEHGASIIFSLRDIQDMWEHDYHIFLSLPHGETLDLFSLGFKFEDALRLLMKNYRKLVLSDMLVREKILYRDAVADLTLLNAAGEKNPGGKCELLLYETSLMVMPERSSIIRLPLGQMDSLQRGDYSLTVMMDSGEQTVLARMGFQTDPFIKALEDALNRLTQNTLDFLMEMLPDVESDRLNRLARLLRDGKMALRKDIEAIAPEIWKQIDLHIISSPLGDEYEFLKSCGETPDIAVGVKRGLPGAAKQDYFWFLIPLSATLNSGKKINVAAFEAGMIQLAKPTGIDEPGSAAPYASETGGMDDCPDTPDNSESDEDTSGETSLLKQEGKATYFFRISAENDPPAPGAPLDHFIHALNRGLMEINFRREPIYLPEGKLNEPRYLKYKYAMNRLPELRRLRNLFLGRALHKSPEQWQKDVRELLDGMHTGAPAPVDPETHTQEKE